MKISQIYNLLNTISPFELQEKWDNSGLNVGSMDKNIEQIYLSLDVDKQMLQAVKPQSLIITHHPLIFGSLSCLKFDKYPSNLLEIMIKKEISLIAMHTNFDKTHLNSYVFSNILGFTPTNSQEYILTTKEKTWQKEELCSMLKQKLSLEKLKIVNPKDTIESIALITGSGASMMDTIDAQCLLTGDIKYHDAMKAISQDLMMVEIGHYESEIFFGDILKGCLKVLPIPAIITNSKNPFSIL
ncbi:MAG TPA: Nif3-like dinuclear metal center hexameric protein [Epsilonproteobacteria bacterium]|nr:Nif3-like dinuclear metal center hexameric protein [Campylobacterota bacterium]